MSAKQTKSLTTHQGIRVIIPHDLAAFDRAVRRAENKIGEELRFIRSDKRGALFAPVGDAAFRRLEEKRCLADRPGIKLPSPSPTLRTIQSRAAKWLAAQALKAGLSTSIMGQFAAGWVADLRKRVRIPAVAIQFAFGVMPISLRSEVK
jgi:hypothetical protein